MSRFKEFLDSHQPEYIEYFRSFKEINEVFDFRTNSLKIITNTKDTFEVSFEVNNRHYKFEAHEVGENQWAVGFDNKFGHSPFELIKSGEYIGNVFGCLVQCIKLLIEKRNIDAFTFSTAKEELVRFYDRLNKYIEKITGFSFTADKTFGEGGKAWLYSKEKI